MAATPAPPPGPALYSIGELSARTGISPHTLRVWERRYGRPSPVRLPSGHRRFRETELAWVQQMAELLSYGHRPGQLKDLPQAELAEMLDEERGASVRDAAELERLLGTVVEGGSAGLRAGLQEALRRLGPRRAVHEYVAPLLQLVGQRWSEGELDVRGEHMVSAAVADVLSATRLELARRRRTPLRPDGPHLILATLPDERHGLGLEMVHLLAELAGAEVISLGVDLPVREIAGAAAEFPGAAIGISVSRNAAGALTERMLGELRSMVPEPASLVVGGQGALVTRRRVTGVDYCGSLHDFERWLEAELPPADEA